MTAASESRPVGGISASLSYLDGAALIWKAILPRLVAPQSCLSRELPVRMRRLLSSAKCRECSECNEIMDSFGVKILSCWDPRHVWHRRQCLRLPVTCH